MNRPAPSLETSRTTSLAFQKKKNKSTLPPLTWFQSFCADEKHVASVDSSTTSNLHQVPRNQHSAFHGVLVRARTDSEQAMHISRSMFPPFQSKGVRAPLKLHRRSSCHMTASFPPEEQQNRTTSNTFPPSSVFGSPISDTLLYETVK